MKTKIFIGACIVIVIVAFASLGGTESTSSGSGNVNQRYMMFSPSAGSRDSFGDVYVIDTQTGRLWKQSFFSDIKGFYMKPQPYISADNVTVSSTPPEFPTLETTAMRITLEKQIEQAKKESEDKK